jgi:hypothetical protein
LILSFIFANKVGVILQRIQKEHLL